MNENIHEERTASETQDRVTELVEQQTAISEVLRAIANSPHDWRPIFDAILDSAARLCRAEVGTLRLFEERGLRLVAVRGYPLLVSQVWSSVPVLDEGSYLARLASKRLPAHIPDFAAFEGDRDSYWIMALNAGFRTGLFVPLLKDNEIVGTICLGRTRVQPFTDKQISLFRDFAAQATIALESTRRERQYREIQMALAYANRVATMGQLTASIAHEIKQPVATARNRTLRFGRFELSGSKRMLRRDGDALPLGSRAFDILVYLAERPGEVIGKKELIDHIWPNVIVEEGSLRVHVAAIRKALWDGRLGSRYIANVKGRGYTFIGSVVRIEDSTETSSTRHVKLDCAVCGTPINGR
jgi:DNA-binding winged helix-turn-helix (wHTH) protein